MADFFNSVLDFFKGIFEGIWNAIVLILETIWGVVKPAFNFILELGGDLISWLWNSVFLPTVQSIINSIDDLPFEGWLEQMNIADVAVGSLATNFMNVNLVVSTLFASFAWLALVAMVKFSIKLIPTVG